MFKNQILKTATATMLVIVMIVGMVASLGKTARADENQGYGTTCTVTYSISDPKLVSSGSLTQEFAAGQPFAIVTPVLKARPGYYLIGYSRTGDASSTVYKRGDTAMFVGNVTLYPVWKKICVLNIDLRNEATVSSGSLEQTFTQSTPFAIDTPVVVSTRPGYYLLGYSTSGDNSTTVYKRGDVAVFADDVTLYPVWKKECKITYCLDAYSELSSGELEQTFTENAQVEIKTPVLKARPGYYLMGFSATGDASTTVYKRGDVARFSTDINLYPVWKAANAPTPTPTTAPNPTSVPTSNPTTAPTQPATPTPTVQGMPAPVLTTTVTPVAEQTYKIVYHNLHGYDAGDDSDIVIFQEAIVGQAVTLMNPEQKQLDDGSIILGWAKIKEPTNREYELGETVASLSSKAGSYIDLYPAVTGSVDIIYCLENGSYPEQFKNAYEFSNVPQNQSIPIATDISQYVSGVVPANHVFAGFATKKDQGKYLSTGNFIEPGIVSSNENPITRLAGIDWIGRKNLAKQLQNEDKAKAYRGEAVLQFDCCFDSNGFLMQKINGVWRPNHVKINLYPVFVEKGADVMVSDEGGMYVQNRVTLPQANEDVICSVQNIEFFLSKEQMEDLNEFFDIIIRLKGTAADESWVDSVSDMLSDVGIIQTLLNLCVEKGSSLLLRFIAGGKATLAMSLFSYVFCYSSKKCKNVYDELVAELGKCIPELRSPHFLKDHMKPVHIQVVICTTECNGNIWVQTVGVEKVEIYDNIILEHEDYGVVGGTWFGSDGIVESFKSLQN